MERDRNCISQRTQWAISTHTLTWSVTRFLCYNTFTVTISTHTLTWSVTVKLIGVAHKCGISTHTLTWSVTQSKHDCQQVKQISTHTLTWSVTLDVVYIWCLLNVMRTYFFYLMGIGLILFTVHSQIAWYFHANLLGICGSLGVRWSKY